MLSGECFVVVVVVITLGDGLASNKWQAFTSTVLYELSCYIGPRYNGTQLC